MKTKIILTILLATTLAGCGIKPHDVEPPANATQDYPRTYPRPTPEDAY